MRIDQIVIALVTPIGCALLYFLLAGEVSGGEAIACALTLAIACPYAVAAARSGTVGLRLPARGLWSLLRAIGGLPSELWRVGAALLRAAGGTPVTGVVKRIPFRFGAFEPADIGRRAAVGTALSLAPNGVALGMDHASDQIVLHQLAAAPVGGDRDWPL